MPTQETMSQQDPSYILSELTSRVRVLESKHSTYGEKLLITNKNMIEEYRKISKEIKNMNEEIVELKQNLTETRELMEKIIKEMGVFAKKDSVKILEKYINLWNPMKFVTEDDVKKVLRGELKSITSHQSDEP
ncbi:MAG: hypothetical protein PHE43_00125 [Candidatus Nanoarchaeia archaeon]|nr:hypothetical protein [Candidatus Nanoarchaeia archaeon]